MFVVSKVPREKMMRGDDEEPKMKPHEEAKE
jgi:hypothetical protein